MPSSALVEAYRARLHLPASTRLPPTWETLCLLTERHLQYIPFENLSMHMLLEKSSSSEKEDEPPIVLSRAALMDKILHRRRGGCCLELNGLFAMLLRDLDFPKVQLVPCWVYAGRERGHQSKKHKKFRVQQSHFLLLVSIPTTTKDDDSSSVIRYMVDVGLGEPPAQPLQYGRSCLDKETVSIEGMKSRIAWDRRGPWQDGQGRTRHCLVLEWWLPDKGLWEPRLQWDVADAPLDNIDNSNGNDKVHCCSEEGPSLESFGYVIPILTHPKSSFARKIIVCKLTRHEKLSLSGRTLKLTSPRFGLDDSRNNKVVVKELEEDKDVYFVLKMEFGIDLSGEELLALNFAASDASSNSKLWEHL